MFRAERDAVLAATETAKDSIDVALLVSSVAVALAAVAVVISVRNSNA